MVDNKPKDITINLRHQDMTDDECYEEIKKAYKKHPDTIMHPDEWMRLRKNYGKQK